MPRLLTRAQRVRTPSHCSPVSHLYSCARPTKLRDCRSSQGAAAGRRACPRRDVRVDAVVRRRAPHGVRRLPVGDAGRDACIGHPSPGSGWVLKTLLADKDSVQATRSVRSRVREMDHTGAARSARGGRARPFRGTGLTTTHARADQVLTGRNAAGVRPAPSSLRPAKYARTSGDNPAARSVHCQTPDGARWRNVSGSKPWRATISCRER